MRRVYIQNACDEIIIDDAQFHHLINVIKQKTGDEISVFDGKTGEYIYKISKVEKKQLVAHKIKKIKDFVPSLDIWLLFAPLKKDATDFVIEKATELGVKKIIPVITKRVNNHNFNQKRAIMQAIDASKQCERHDVPEIEEPLKLKEVIKNWDNDRTLYPLLERSEASNIYAAFNENKSQKIAILVGPEGGFDDEEKDILKKFAPISLGQRILRAETASLAAIACYQAINGDFN